MKRVCILIIPVVSIMFACVSPKGENKETEQIEVDTPEYAQELEYLLPSPAEFFSVIKEVGLDYDSKIIRPIENASNFKLYRNQALNFGMYLTDFSYLLLFEKQSEAIKYLYHIQDMAKLLDIENFFDDEFFDKLLASLNEPDTLRSLSIEQSASFFTRMDAIGNNDLVLFVTSGSIIETMYIALNVVDEQSITQEAITSIVDLSFIFDSFYLNYMLMKTESEDIALLTDSLKELRETFISMEIKQVSKSTQKDGKLVLTSELTHNVNESNIKNMKAQVNSIRKNIVNQAY